MNDKDDDITRQIATSRSLLQGATHITLRDFDALSNERLDLSADVIALLLVAARLDELRHSFEEHIHRAGEGI